MLHKRHLIWLALCLICLPGAVLLADAKDSKNEEVQVRAAFEQFWQGSWNWGNPEEIKQVIGFPFTEMDLTPGLRRREYSRVVSHRSAEDLSRYINGMDGSAALDGRRPPATDVVVHPMNQSTAHVSFTVTLTNKQTLPLVAVLTKNKDGWRVVFSAFP